jgi:hypothetical protein
MTVWPNYSENYAAEALKAFQGNRVVEKSILPGKDLTEFVAKIKAVMFKNPPRNPMVDIPFSDTTKKVLANTDHLADSANQYIMIEHLLSSLLPEFSPPIKNLWADITGK